MGYGPVGSDDAAALDILDGAGRDREALDGSPDPGASASASSSPGASASSSADTSASSSPAPARNRGGRPRGSKTKTRRADGSVRLRVDAASKGPKRDRSAGSQSSSAASSTSSAPVEAQTATAAIVATCELIACTLIGPEARLQPLERAMIEPPAARILARMDPDAIGRYSALADPIILSVGLGIYGLRVWTISRAQNADHDAPPGEGSSERAARSPEAGTAAPSPAESPNGGGLVVHGQADELVTVVPMAIRAAVEDDLNGF